MKLSIWGFILLALVATPSLSFAKGAPLFFNTGDELFEIEGAPTFESGYSVGYACKRFGLFGADIWTWDCNLMAINIDEFAAGELPEELKQEYTQKYSLGDRKRNPWNHYGALLLIGGLVGVAGVKARK